MAHHRMIRALGIGSGALALALLAGTASAAPALNPGSLPAETSTCPSGNSRSRSARRFTDDDQPARLEGASGYQDSYFYTNKSDGSMEFWDPENGVTTPNSNYARSELREMNSSGSAACLVAARHAHAQRDGQGHQGARSRLRRPDPCRRPPHDQAAGRAVFHSNGEIQIGIENGPSGGQTAHTSARVPLGQQFSYVIQVTGGNTISVTINGSKHSFPIPSSWKGYQQYFKAGDYDQSSGSSSTVGA